MPQVVLQSSWWTYCQLGITISKLPGHAPSQPSSGLSGCSCKVGGKAVPRGTSSLGTQGERNTQRYIYLQHTRKRFLHQRAVGMAMSPWSSRSVWTLLSDIIWILGGLVLRQFGLDPFGFFPNRDILWFFEKEGSNIPLLANGTPTTHANDWFPFINSQVLWLLNKYAAWSCSVFWRVIRVYPPLKCWIWAASTEKLHCNREYTVSLFFFLRNKTWASEWLTTHILCDHWVLAFFHALVLT